MNSSEEHFNSIAEEYDYWKENNYYYHKNLINLYKSKIREGSSVADIGYGTGDVLNEVNPKRGLGIDTSSAMVKIADRKYFSNTNLKFEHADICILNKKLDYDYIILADVLEHVENLQEFVICLKKVADDKTKIVISVANSIWEPILHIAEKLKLKRPEGPHNRLSIRNNEDIFLLSGFNMIDKGYRLLIPIKLPFADTINRNFYKSRCLEKLGFIVYWALE